ncbi:MAG TPA: patatin [Desulfotomaculum sp.]|nr:MAG: Patatin [Desulfotomaculum sp. 46_80]KUK85320.1 MAG: Patatin [Desulfofundulus kuznetsovii]HAG10576.1 patatin [Desulfotomaculum sp.]HBY03467.1 patatin [Desulfotomaculum sp.]
MARRKFGIALGGGFLRGAAHIGVLKVLAREGFKPDMVAGTSAGSIIASLYCSGWSPERLEKIALKLKPGCFYDLCSTIINLGGMAMAALLDFFKLPFYIKVPLGLTSGKRLKAWLEGELERKTFYDLGTALAITSVDVNTGQRIVFVSGDTEYEHLRNSHDIVFIRGVNISDAVVASCAVPGFFTPKKIGIRLLVDGGLRANIPVEVVSLIGAERVIAIDVGYDGEPYKKINNIFQLLSQSLDIIASKRINNELGDYADLVIRPLLKNVAPWDFDLIPYCIEQGEKAALECIPQIRKLLES